MGENGIDIDTDWQEVAGTSNQ